MQDLRLGFFDKVILSMATVGAGWSGYSLYQNQVHVKMSGYDRPSVAKVKVARNDVRRRVGRSFQWFPLSSEDPLFDQDSVFTGADSEVDLSMGDGVSLSLGPNSLVVVSRNHKDLQLDLQVGEMIAKVDSRKSISIVQAGKVAKVSSSNSGSVKLTRSKVGDLHMTGLQGKSKVQVGKSVQNLNMNEALSVDKAQKVYKKEFPFAPVQPRGSQPVWLSQGESIQIKWKKLTANAPSEVWLQLSYDRDFSQLIFSQKAKGGLQEITHLVMGRRYYWRLVSDREGVLLQSLSAISSFRVFSKSKPEIVFPLDGQKLFSDEVLQPGMTQKITLKWKPSPGVKHFEVLVSRSSEFAPVLFSESTAKSESTVSLKMGKYYWKVRPVFKGDSQKLWSETYSFFVGKDDPSQKPLAQVPLEAPELTTSADSPLPESDIPELLDQKMEKVGEESKNEENIPQIPKIRNKSEKVSLRYERLKNVRDLASVEKSLLNPPRLSWATKSGELTKYQLQISEKKDFSETVLDKSVMKTAYTWKSVRPGRYYWRVQAQNSKGEAKGFSSLGRLQVNLAPPKATKANHEKIIRSKDPKKIESLTSVHFPISWTELPFAESYRVVVTKEKNKKKSLEDIQVKESKWKFKVKDSGKYQVRIAALDKQGRSLSSFSKPIEVKFKKDLILDKPKLLLPGEGVTLVSFGDGPKDPIIFSWEKIPHVETYQLQFSRDENFEKVIKKKIVKKSSYILKDIPEGKIYWRLRGMYKSYSSPWSESRSFDFDNVNFSN